MKDFLSKFLLVILVKFLAEPQSKFPKEPIMELGNFLKFSWKNLRKNSLSRLVRRLNKKSWGNSRKISWLMSWEVSATPGMPISSLLDVTSQLEQSLLLFDEDFYSLLNESVWLHEGAFYAEGSRSNFLPNFLLNTQTLSASTTLTYLGGVSRWFLIHFQVCVSGVCQLKQKKT